MGVNISIKNVPKKKLDALKLRAKRNHRSLQGELMSLIDEATTAASKPAVTVRELYERGLALGLKTPDESVRWVRELRDSR